MSWNPLVPPSRCRICHCHPAAATLWNSVWGEGTRHSMHGGRWLPASRQHQGACPVSWELCGKQRDRLGGSERVAASTSPSGLVYQQRAPALPECPSQPRPQGRPYSFSFGAPESAGQPRMRSDWPAGKRADRRGADSPGPAVIVAWFVLGKWLSPMGYWPPSRILFIWSPRLLRKRQIVAE